MTEPTFLASKIREIRDRLSELQPVYQEYLALQKVLEVIETSGHTPAAKARRGRGKPSTRATARLARPKRKKGTLATEVLRLVGKDPGLTARQLADRLRTKPQAAYQVLRRLESTGQIARTEPDGGARARGYVLPTKGTAKS